MGVSFAIPIDLAMGAVEQLKETGRVRRGMIGVTLQEIDTETAKGLGLPDARGALINDVSPGSAGDKAGLRIGDVVRSRSEEHTSELQSLMRISYAVFCLKKKKPTKTNTKKYKNLQETIKKNITRKT